MYKNNTVALSYYYFLYTNDKFKASTSDVSFLMFVYFHEEGVCNHCLCKQHRRNILHVQGTRNHKKNRREIHGVWAVPTVIHWKHNHQPCVSRTTIAIYFSWKTHIQRVYNCDSYDIHVCKLYGLRTYLCSWKKKYRTLHIDTPRCYVLIVSFQDCILVTCFSFFFLV